MVAERMHGDDRSDAGTYCEKDVRLIDWTTEVLAGFLEKIVPRRLEARGQLSLRPKPTFKESCNVLDEVTAIIALPPFDPYAAVTNAVIVPSKFQGKSTFNLESSLQQLLP